MPVQLIVRRSGHRQFWKAWLITSVTLCEFIPQVTKKRKEQGLWSNGKYISILSQQTSYPYCRILHIYLDLSGLISEKLKLFQISTPQNDTCPSGFRPAQPENDQRLQKHLWRGQERWRHLEPCQWVCRRIVYPEVGAVYSEIAQFSIYQEDRGMNRTKAHLYGTSLNLRQQIRNIQGNVWKILHDWSLQLYTQLKPLRNRCSALPTELSSQLGAGHAVSL